jgi:hypothetical protein
MNDYEIREILCDYIDRKYEKVRIYDELVIGSSRADILAVTDCLTGYEIKGDSDSYVRLPTQTRDYSRYFKDNYIVIGASHKKNVEKHIPDYWGIICVYLSDGEKTVELLRELKNNPEFSTRKQLSLLWRAELTHILQLNNLPKYTKKDKGFIIRKLIATVEPDRLRLQICEELFERDYTKFKAV